MSKIISLPEILRRLRKLGYKYSEHTFRYHQKLNLLPMPKKVPVKKGRGMIGVYPVFTVELIAKILDWQAQGKTLDEVLIALNQRTVKRFQEALSKLGYSDYMLAELTGFPREILEKSYEDEATFCRETIQKRVKEKFPNLSESEAEDIISTLVDASSFKGIIERTLLKTFHFWNPAEVFEIEALKYVAHALDDKIAGLNTAGMLVILDPKKLLDQSEKKTAVKIGSMLRAKMYEFQVLLACHNARLAGLSADYPEAVGADSKGVYQGLTEKEWKDREEDYKNLLQAIAVETDS